MRKMQTIEILSDKYSLRRTFDILDDQGGVEGFDVLNEDKEFLFHYDTKNEEDVVSEIKWRIYRIHDLS